MTLIDQAIREPEVESARHYAQRVYQLAWFYVILFFCSLAGIGMLIWQAQLYVTLAQRSNVETLTLAFFFLFFGYLAVLSASGCVGAGRLFWYWARGRLSADLDAVEREKVRALGPPRDQPATVALNKVIELEGQPRLPVTLNIADRAGSMGRLVVDGAELTHYEVTRDGSNTLLAFFVHQVNLVSRERGVPAGMQIIEWKKVDDEATDKYLMLVRFAGHLEQRLGAAELWPKHIMTRADCEELERRLSAICSALRNEAFLPQWEYQGEHKIPLIPEPLGLISLSRTEKRVDPLATMGCAVSIVAVVLFVLVLIVFFPPWVPGK